MEEPLNHQKIYTENGSPKGAAHGEGVDDGTAQSSDGEAREAISGSFKKREGANSRHAGQGDRLQSLLCELGVAALRQAAPDEDRGKDG